MRTTVRCSECEERLNIDLTLDDMIYFDDIVKEMGWTVISDSDHSIFFCPYCGG